MITPQSLINYCPDFVITGDMFIQVYDFDTDDDLTTRNWTFNVTNSTAPTTVTDSKGGTAVFTNSAADNDRIEATNAVEVFKCDALGQQSLFFARAKLGEVGQQDVGFGWGITDADWLGDSALLSDAFFWQLSDGNSNWDGITAFNAAALSDYSKQTAMKAADTSWHRFAILVETDAQTQGKGRVRWYYDGVVVGIYQPSTANLCYDEELALMFGVQNGEAVAKSLTLDLIGGAQQR